MNDIRGRLLAQSLIWRLTTQSTVRSSVVVEVQVDDLFDDLRLGRVGADMGTMGAVPEPDETFLLVAAIPDVERLPADPVVAARLGDVAGDLLGMADHLQTVFRLPLELLLGHARPPSAHGEVAGLRRPQVSSISVSSRGARKSHLAYGLNKKGSPVFDALRPLESRSEEHTS